MGKEKYVEVTTVVRYKMGTRSWPDDGFDSVFDRMIRFLRESQTHTLYEAAGRNWIDGKFYIEVDVRRVSKVLLHKGDQYDDEKTWETFDGQTIGPKGEVTNGNQA